jgi:hypothetical protein
MIRFTSSEWSTTEEEDRYREENVLIFVPSCRYLLSLRHTVLTKLYVSISNQFQSTRFGFPLVGTLRETLVIGFLLIRGTYCRSVLSESNNFNNNSTSSKQHQVDSFVSLYCSVLTVNDKFRFWENRIDYGARSLKGSMVVRTIQ